MPGLSGLIVSILDNWFDESEIKSENRVNYLVLCEHYNEEKTFKCKHFKKLVKRFKKEVKNA